MTFILLMVMLIADSDIALYMLGVDLRFIYINSFDCQNNPMGYVIFPFTDKETEA